MAVKIRPITAGWIIAILYVALIAGFFIPQTRKFTQYLIWPVLLATTIGLLCFHKKWSREFVLSAFLIASAGFLLEVVAVKTGYVYGYFQFGTALGYKFWDTPLMMMAYWFTLIYVSRQVAEMIAKDIFLISVLASGLMLLIDYFIEPFAIRHALWTWNGGNVSIFKYIGFSLSALVIQYIYCKSIKIPANKLSLVIYLLMLGFFIAMYLLQPHMH